MRKDPIKKYNFTVFFEPVTEGGYAVVIPSLPGLITYGRTLREAREMAIDAIKCHCEGLLKDGEPIPEDEEPSKKPLKEKISVTFDYA